MGLSATIEGERPSVTLYIAGRGRRSTDGIEAAEQIADRFGALALSVVDILEHPAAAESASVLVVPTIVLRRPQQPDQIVAGEIPVASELAAHLGLTYPFDWLADAAAHDASAKALIWHHNPDGIVVIDANGLVCFVNEAAEVLFGRLAGTLIGEPLQFQPAPEGPTELNILRDGEALTVELRTASITWERQPAVMATLRDITDRKRAEVELETVRTELARSNEDLQRFAAVASHDLKSPLTIINMASQTLVGLHGNELGEGGAQVVDMIVRSVTRMTALLDGLLAAARVGNELDYEQVDCGAIVAEVVAMLDELLATAGATVVVGSLPTVVGDGVQLGEVFQNLVSNAIKYRSAHRPLRVEITSARSGSDIVFTVADNGIGIEPADRTRIFTMLSRLEDGMELAEGHGIGLSICRRVIERHGGRIWLDGSREGTSFHFTLPEDRRSS